MKQIKDNIVYVLVGFTLVVSVYTTIKVNQNEKKINQNCEFIQEIEEKLK